MIPLSSIFVTFILFFSSSLWAQPVTDALVNQLRSHSNTLRGLQPDGNWGKNVTGMAIRDTHRMVTPGLVGAAERAANGQQLVRIIEMGQDRMERALKTYFDPNSTAQDKRRAINTLNNTAQRVHLYSTERNSLIQRIIEKTGVKSWEGKDRLKNNQPSESLKRFLSAYGQERASGKGETRSVRSALSVETQHRRSLRAKARTQTVRPQGRDVPDVFN